LCRIFLTALLIGQTVFGYGRVFAALEGSSAGKAADSGAGAGELETVLNTLNDTLEENRKLKKQLTDTQEEIKKVGAESNAMRGQLRVFEKDRERKTGKQEEEVSKLAEQLKQSQSEVGALNGKLKAIEEKLEETAKEKAALAGETEKMQAMLKGSVMQEESEELRKLLSEVQKSSNDLLKKTMETDRDKERLRQEASTLNFQMGNVAFRNRDFETALVYYQKTLQLNPADSNAHHNLGIIFDYYIPDPDRAIHHYRCFLNLAPVDDAANQIRERVLELRLRKSIIPAEPLQGDHYKYAHYTN
jgi:tetratricopeptide (TPR) repeat protein